MDRYKFVLLALGLSFACIGCGKKDKSVSGKVQESTIETTSEKSSESTNESNSDSTTESTVTPQANQTTYWSMNVDDYEISLMSTNKEDCYQLVKKDDCSEEVLRNYTEDDYINPNKFSGGTFSDLMGYSGFYVFDCSTSMFEAMHYYTIEDDKLVSLGESWGTNAEDSYIVDVNDDGVTELVTNVVYGDGLQDAMIYCREGNQIVSASLSDLLDVEYDNVGIGSQETNYLPEENCVQIDYWKADKQEYLTKKYQIDLTRLKLSAYEPTIK